MRFYIIVALLALLQASVLVGIFKSFLYAPNPVYAFLFITLLKEEGMTFKKPIFAGLFLDLMHDSLGLHIFGSLLFAELITLLRSRYEFPNLTALIVVYGIITLIVRAFLFLLFRLKFYVSFDLALFSAGFLTELFILYILTRFYKV